MPKKPVKAPKQGKKKGHGLLYTSIIIGVPCAALVYYRLSNTAQDLVKYKMPQLEKPLAFCIPSYHTPIVLYWKVLY